MTSNGRDLTIRPGVILGPAIMRGGVPVHVVHNAEEDCYYQIGEREYFIIEKLKRGFELDQISLLYANTFGKTLGEKSWLQIATLLDDKGLLLASGLDDTPKNCKKSLSRQWGLISGKFGLFDPNPLLAKIEHNFPWMLSKRALVVSLMSFVALCLVVALNFESMADKIGHLLVEYPTATVLVVLVMVVVLFFHEMGHALACVAAGSDCREIGIAWRIPMFYFYTATSDVYLVSAKRRVMISAAGMLVGSLALLPFVVVYLFLGEGIWVQVIASILYVGFFASVINLIPFFCLDGQKILSHSLAVWDVSAEGKAWLLNLAKRKVPREGFSFGVKIFAIFELFAMAAMAVCGTWWWFAFLTPKVGIPWTALILILVWLGAGSILVVFVLRNRRNRYGDSYFKSDS